MLPILMYHKVEAPGVGRHWEGNYVLPEQFDAQLAALARWGYTSISVEEWLDLPSSRKHAPQKPIAITFDDGYLSNFVVAWPILRRHGARATIFLVADLIGQTNQWEVGETEDPLLGVPEILLMQRQGARFGSHTCTHRPLTEIAEGEASLELRQSKNRLEAILGRSVTTLAYPYNKQNRKVRALAEQAGYRAAVLGRGRINAPWTNRLMLRRIRVDLATTVEGLGNRLTRLRWLVGC